MTAGSSGSDERQVPLFAGSQPEGATPALTTAERWMLAALAGLPGMFPPRLRAVVAGRPVRDAWQSVLDGRGAKLPSVRAVVRRGADDLAASWRRAASRIDLDEVAAAHLQAGVTVLVPTDDAYPAPLAADPEPPAVLFSQGDLSQLSLPAVAIVGTRRCTHAGREIARWLGRAVCESGAAVVSGLALGVDGAAHAGALMAQEGGVVGVVGNGLDVPYPRRHRELWGAVRERGVLLSEAPLGAPPAGWRFPARNRIIAALATVVVVVESHDHGGSLVTARLALERDRTVLAVPGSIRSPAAAGTNALLRDGAVPLLDLDDLSVAMSMAGRPLPSDLRPRPSSTEAQAKRSPVEQRVFEAVAFDPASTEAVITRTGLPTGTVVSALRSLEADGLLVATSGGWWERT